MKVKELKLLLNQLPEDLDIVYSSYSEGILMGIEGVKQTQDYRAGKLKNIATIEECMED